MTGFPTVAPPVPTAHVLASPSPWAFTWQRRRNTSSIKLKLKRARFGLSLWALCAALHRGAGRTCSASPSGVAEAPSPALGSQMQWVGMCPKNQGEQQHMVRQLGGRPTCGKARESP